MASPPKPWERPGAATAATGLTASPSLASAPPTSSAMAAVAGPSSSTSLSPSSNAASTATAPPLPERPSSLASAVNQNASAYSRVGVGASLYGSYAGAYTSPYSSPYSRFGGMGAYGSGMYGGYGGGMYGSMYGGMPGVPGSPNDPNSLTNRFSNGTAATFQMLEGIVTAFGGFAQMLESTYMATHSSFFAMVSVAEQFGNLRDTLGSILGIFTLLRWIRTLMAKLTGRPPPADAMALTPAAFARFEGRAPGPDGAAVPAKASRKPLLFFLAAAFGLPYLMSKMIRVLASAHHADERGLQQQAIDPSQLEFCRLLYDYLPPAPAGGSLGLELPARKGNLVAVLTKNDPAGNPCEWWQCRSRDGRQGYLPSTYLELLKRPDQDVKAIQPAPAEKPLPSRSPQRQQQEDGVNKEHATLDSMQRSQFHS